MTTINDNLTVEEELLRDKELALEDIRYVLKCSCNVIVDDLKYIYIYISKYFVLFILVLQLMIFLPRKKR